MILGETPRAMGTATTLDDLFRRAGVRHPDALALADPPNRQSFIRGSPRALSFAQAEATPRQHRSGPRSLTGRIAGTRRQPAAIGFRF
jgi:hypothetical protein